jgi:hypothetical protein
MMQKEQLDEITKASAPAAGSQVAKPQIAWPRRVFAFPVMCMFLFIAVIFGYAPRGITIGESDIWWHLLNARNLLQHHSLSRIDTRAFTVAGSPWMSFEWLSEIPFYLAFRHAGLQGIVVLYATIMVLIIAGVYYRSWRAGADCKDAAVATLGAICIGCVSLCPRPLLFGWLCLTALLLVLDEFRRTGRCLWLLAPLFLLWINLHGSWIYGMAVLFLTITAGLVEGEWSEVASIRWSKSQLRQLLLVSAASLAALFVNPFGYKLVMYPFDFLLRQQAVMHGSEYWLPVDFSTWNGKLALALIFAIVAAALFSPRRWRLDEVLLLALALWSGLSHMRFLDFAAIIIVPILAPRLKLFPPYEAEIDKPWLNATIIVVIVACIILLFPTEQTLQAQLEQEYPKAALEFMQHQQISGRVFNSVEFGGYMEWNTPALKPFIDGRGDIFIHNGIFADYTKATMLQNPQAVLDKYNIDYVLVERSWPLGYVLQHSPNWRLIYSDKVAVVLERTPTVSAAGAS